MASLHGVPPPVVQHYVAATAVAQKIEALIGRTQTRARDLFDLQVLHSQQPTWPSLQTSLRGQLPRAIENARSLSYDDYLGQVVAYLEPAQASALSDRPTWEAMQLEVVEWLEELTA